MLKKTIGIVLGTMLGAAVLVAQRPESSHVEACESPAKNANLNFTLKDIDGKNVDLNTYKGNVVLLDFWATWCQPCKKEIPGFVDLYNKYKDRGFVVIGVSVDEAGSFSILKKFAKRFNMNYPVLVGHDREDIKKAFAPISGFPTTFVISRDGKICFRHTGFAPLEKFEETIKALL
jgi:peroxiredoxin